LQNNVLLLTAGIPTPAERCLGHFTRTSNNFTNSHIGSIDLKKYDKITKQGDPLKKEWKKNISRKSAEKA